LSYVTTIGQILDLSCMPDACSSMEPKSGWTFLFYRYPNSYRPKIFVHGGVSSNLETNVDCKSTEIGLKKQQIQR